MSKPYLLESVSREPLADGMVNGSAHGDRRQAVILGKFQVVRFCRVDEYVLLGLRQHPVEASYQDSGAFGQRQHAPQHVLKLGRACFACGGVIYCKIHLQRSSQLWQEMNDCQ